MALSSRKHIALLFVAALVILFSLGAVYFLRSGSFTIQNIVVQGVKLSSENDFLKLSGDVLGQNLFLFDQEILKNKITLHPLVRDVQFQQKLPHTLIIVITERTPIALVTASGAVLEVDAEGTFLRRLESWPKTDYPVITGVELKNAVGPGQNLVDPSLMSALALLKQAPPGLTAQTGELNVNAYQQMTLYLMSGVEVRLGQNREWKTKLDALYQLISAADYQSFEKEVRYIDFTAAKPVIGR